MQVSFINAELLLWNMTQISHRNTYPCFFNKQHVYTCYSWYRTSQHVLAEWSLSASRCCVFSLLECLIGDLYSFSYQGVHTFGFIVHFIKVSQFIQMLCSGSLWFKYWYYLYITYEKSTSIFAKRQQYYRNGNIQINNNIRCSVCEAGTCFF